MTVTKFLDTKLDKDTDDILLLDKNGNQVMNINYDILNVHDIKYQKIAIVIVE